MKIADDWKTTAKLPSFDLKSNGNFIYNSMIRKGYNEKW